MISEDHSQEEGFPAIILVMNYRFSWNQGYLRNWFINEFCDGVHI